MYVNIDDCFFIKCKKPDETLLKSIAFVANQKKVTNLIIKKAYEKNDKIKINLPKNLLKKNIDIIIKRNFKNDFKFIDIKKFEIFYSIDIKTNLFFEILTNHLLSHKAPQLGHLKNLSLLQLARDKTQLQSNV